MEQKDYKTVFKKIQETNAIREILAGINWINNNFKLDYKDEK